MGSEITENKHNLTFQEKPEMGRGTEIRADKQFKSLTDNLMDVRTENTENIGFPPTTEDLDLIINQILTPALLHIIIY